MIFVIICKDKKKSLEKRLKARPEHINYLKCLGKKLLMAGPILDKKKQPEGSVIIINSEDRKEINNFLKKDPYNRIGLFREVKVVAFKKVF